MINNSLQTGNTFNNRIRKIADNIGLFTQTSEGIFISIGNKLQKFLTNSRELSNISADAASSFTDEVIQKGISELTLLSGRFNDHLIESTRGIKNEKEELQNILNQIELITNELKGFRKIVKRLKMLGISTKIESSKLGSEDNGFYLLAEQVDSLSGLINEKATIIINQAGILSEKIIGASSNLLNLEEELHKQSDNVLNNITLSLNILTEKSQEYFSKMEKISNYSESLSRNISDIVVSIQFHDITRQQMEHVKDALLEAGRDFGTVSNDEGDLKSAKLGLIYDVCELQFIQLTSSINEFRTAVERIITGLKGVEENVNIILNTTLELLFNNNNSTESSYKDVQNELSAISAGLNNNLKIEEELSDSINSVIMILNDLANYLIDIEDVGTEIEIISLNARIKAAHIGSNGLTLGVLAQAIQNISHDAKSQTLSISGILNTISNVSTNLNKNNGQNELENKHQGISSTNDKIVALVNAMIQSEKDAGTITRELQERVNKLRNEVSRSIEEISVLSDTRDSLDHTVDELLTITKSIQLNDKFRSNRENNTKEINERYTMKSERQIHENYISNYSPDSNNSSIKDDDHYNDNVELF